MRDPSGSQTPRCLPAARTATDYTLDFEITFCVRGVISPLLANIYLHYAFDQWVQRWRKPPGREDVIVVRYADDSVLGFEQERTAQEFLEQLQERLAKFGLALHPDKTRIIELGRFAAERQRARKQRRPETFDVLGFTHCCGTDQQGKFELHRVTVKKRMRVTLTTIRDTFYRWWVLGWNGSCVVILPTTQFLRT